MQYPTHPACALWPRPSDEEVKALAASIKAEGLHNPIWLYEGAVLDGKTRYEACEIAGIEPRFQEYTGNDPIKFTIAQNRFRRHMGVGELSLIVAELCKLPQSTGRNQHTPRSGLARPHLLSEEKTAEELAKEAGIGRSNVVSAKTVLNRGEPNIIEMVRTNKVGAQGAAYFVRNKSREEQRAATVSQVKKSREHQGKKRFDRSQSTITIPLRDMLDKFRPLIKRIKEQSKRHAATVSFTELSIIAHEFEQLADSWMKNGSELGTHSDPVSFNRVHEGG